MGNLILNAEKGFLILNFSKKQKLNASMLQACADVDFRHMLPIEYRQDKNAARYKLEGKISLAVRLEEVMDRFELFLVMSNLYRAMKELFDLGVSPNNLDWDPDLVFVDEYGEIYFLLYPTTPKTVEGGGIYDLIMYVLKKFKPIGKLDKDVKDFYKEQHGKVTRQEISREEYIQSLGINVTQQLDKIGIKNVDLGRLYAIIHGMKIAVEGADEDVYETVNGFTFMEDDIYTDVQEGTTYIVESDMVISDEDDDGTQVLITKATKLIGYLGVKGTDETFKLERTGTIDEWVFGRALTKGNSDVDCELKGNAVSRVHFKISIENDDFYIEDLGSSNGTTVNGMKLGVNKPVELFDKSKVKAGDVEMQFLVNEVEVD
jgi:FHA domain containing protein